METNCPGTPQCPIFNGILENKAMTAKSYRIQFCEADKTKWSNCKRYMTKQQFGTCPADLLPNSSLSLEQIGVKYSLV